jgi:hypothetical protein
MADQNLRQKMSRRLGAALMARHSLRAMLKANTDPNGGGFLDQAVAAQAQKLTDVLDGLLGPEPPPANNPPRQPRRVPQAQPVPQE